MTAFIGRREFITRLGGAAAAWPMRRGRSSVKAADYRPLGFVNAVRFGSWTTAFQQRLRELAGGTVATHRDRVSLGGGTR